MPAKPVEFTRLGSGTDRAGNRVQLEHPDGQQVNDNHPLPVDVVASNEWTFADYIDTGTGSNKIVSVPAGEIWQILSIYVELTTAATVNNRQVEVRPRDDIDDVFMAIVAGDVQAASLTRRYAFAPGLSDLTLFRDTDFLMTPLHNTLFLMPGENLRIFDNAAVDPTNDDLSIHIRYAWKSST